MKIVSGGQTGVDRAALDVALKHQMPSGGWCPAGRRDESGRIPEHYPVHELPSADFAERTLRNVLDSDGTVVIYWAELSGGTEHTLRCCADHNRPHLLIDAAVMSATQAADALDQFVQAQEINTLNVAGPRQSEWSDGYGYTFALLESLLRESTA
jgi:hypothetical protein